MKNKELTVQLMLKLEQEEKEKKDSLFRDEVNGDYSPLSYYIQHLEKQDPNALVMISNGECENPGVYVPLKKDGSFDFEEAKPFKEGEAFPGDGEWIQISYLPQPKLKQSLSH